MWKKSKLEKNGWKNEILSRSFIGLNLIMRITSILDWVFILVKDIFTQKRTSFIKIVLINVLHCVIAISIAVAFESLFYGELTYTGWNFLKFNVLNDGASKYGVSSPFYYVLT